MPDNLRRYSCRLLAYQWQRESGQVYTMIYPGPNMAGILL
jgi:hypothetical protein